MGLYKNRSVFIFKSIQGPETTDSSMCNPLNSICTAKPADSIHTLMSRLCAKWSREEQNPPLGTRGWAKAFLAPLVRRRGDKALREQSRLRTSGDVYLNSEEIPSSARRADGERERDREIREGNDSARQVSQDQRGAPSVSQRPRLMITDVY